MEEKDETKLTENVERTDMDVEGNKVLEWFKKNICNLFLIGLSIYFIFNGAISLVPNEMRWQEKLVYIFTTLIFGIIISSLVGESGYTAGKDSDEYKQSRKDAIAACEKALPYRKEAELYVSLKIDHDIKLERIEILSKACINYEEIFNDNDIPRPMKEIKKEKFSRQQIRAVKQAIRVKKIPFALFGFTPVKSVGRKSAPNESKRRKNKIASSFVIKVVMAFASGSVAVSFIGISLESVIYSVFQLMLWFGSGIITRVSNYNFIVNNVREYDKERTWYLKEFIALPQDEKDKLRMMVSETESRAEGIKRLPYKPTTNVVESK